LCTDVDGQAAEGQQLGATSQQLRGIRVTLQQSRRDGAGHITLQNDSNENKW